MCLHTDVRQTTLLFDNGIVLLTLKKIDITSTWVRTIDSVVYWNQIDIISTWVRTIDSVVYWNQIPTRYTETT